MRCKTQTIFCVLPTVKQTSRGSTQNHQAPPPFKRRPIWLPRHRQIPSCHDATPQYTRPGLQHIASSNHLWSIARGCLCLLKSTRDFQQPPYTPALARSMVTEGASTESSLSSHCREVIQGFVRHATPSSWRPLLHPKPGWKLSKEMESI